jgi:hypothetical protein
MDFIAGNIGRLTNVSSVGTTDKVPVVQSGKLMYATASQLSTAAGDVVGPGSSTDNAIARFDSTTGKIIQNSGCTIDDSNNATIAGDLTVSGGDIDAGASGAAGSVDIFPSTASKGKTSFTATDNTGNTTTTINTAAQATTRAYTIPDAGADASFLLTQGAQTIAGVQTFTSPQVLSSGTGITAFAGGGQASATALTAQYNLVTTVASNFDSVKLLTAVTGQIQVVKNTGAAILSVFPNTSDAINGLAVNLSIDIPIGGEVTFRAIDATTWHTMTTLDLPAPSTQKGTLVMKAADNAGNTQTIITNASFGQASTLTIPDPGNATSSFVMDKGAATIAGVKTFSSAPVLSVGLSAADNLTMTVAAKGLLLKQGANGKCGTFVANGVTPVTVSNSSIATTDAIIISLNTVGGTVGVQPHVATITASSGFTVVCTASDTSTYNYAIISNAA